MSDIAAAKESRNPHSGLLIAVVDDDPRDLENIVGSLASEGICNVIALDNPGLLMRAVATSDIGLVLLDLVMPGTSGIEVLAQLRQKYPHVAVAIVSHNRDLDQAIDCMRLGASDYIVKPADKPRLVTTVRRLMEVQELTRESQALGKSFLESNYHRPPAFMSIVGLDFP